MKGIVLAGGMGTRLQPLTLVTSKQLLPVYNKPMIYYPMSVLMLAGLRDVLIISTPHDLPNYEKLFGDGSRIGMNIQYAEQPSPDGLAQAFTIGRDFIDGGPACLILGDNIFYARGLTSILKHSAAITDGAVVFGYKVRDPERFGVVEFDRDGRVLSIEEKPDRPKSSYAVTGLYFYDHNVCDMAAELKPSKRGEYEITDLNRAYLTRGNLKVEVFSRGAVWLDAGTHFSLKEATDFVYSIERHQQFKIGCIEEVAFRNGWLDNSQLEELIGHMGDNEYSMYLKTVLHEIRS